MTYNERVQKLAEKMAKEKAPISWPQLIQEGKEVLIKRQLINSRIAVAEIVSELKLYAYGSIADYEDLAAGGYTGDFDKELLDRGLIPAQEGGQDEKA